MGNTYGCDYAKAAEEIASRHGIKIEWRDSTRGRAWRKVRTVRLKIPRHMGHFAIALHELGHIAGKTGVTRLEKEYNAWQWALENTPIPFDNAAWLELHACLRSYVTWAEMRQYRKNVRPVLPPKEHPMWHLLATAKASF